MSPRPPNHSDIGAKLDALHDLVTGLRDDVKDFTAMKSDLQQVIEIYSAGRGAVKVGKWAGKLVLWIGGLVASIGGAIAVAKGWLPK